MSIVNPLSSSGSNPNPSAQGSSSVGQNQFLQLLVAQLKYQDPMHPMNSQSFLAELAQFQSLQQLTSLQNSMSAVQQDTQINSATALLNHGVTYKDAQGALQHGTVSSVQISANGVAVMVGSTAVPLASVQDVAP